MKCVLGLLVAVGLCTPAVAAPPSGLSIACGKAYESMMVCRKKFATSDAPASMKQMFETQYEKQMSDAVKMWRSMRGVESVEKSCKEIAANSECAD